MRQFVNELDGVRNPPGCHLAIEVGQQFIGADLGEIALLPWVITAYLATSAVAVIVAAIVLNEPVLLASLIGGGTILFGVWLVNRKPERAQS